MSMFFGYFFNFGKSNLWITLQYFLSFFSQINALLKYSFHNYTILYVEDYKYKIILCEKFKFLQ